MKRVEESWLQIAQDRKLWKFTRDIYRAVDSKGLMKMMFEMSNLTFAYLKYLLNLKQSIKYFEE